MGGGKHTPGPWSVPHFAQPDVNCECGYVLTDNLMGAVATVHCSGKGRDWLKHGDNPRLEEAVANAHLIAAAPDLLAALTRLMEQKTTSPLNMTPDERKELWAAHEEARAAIAAATPTA